MQVSAWTLFLLLFFLLSDKSKHSFELYPKTTDLKFFSNIIKVYNGGATTFNTMTSDRTALCKMMLNGMTLCRMELWRMSPCKMILRTSEWQCSDNFTENNFLQNEAEQNDSGQNCIVQNDNLQSIIQTVTNRTVKRLWHSIQLSVLLECHSVVSFCWVSFCCLSFCRLSFMAPKWSVLHVLKWK